MKTTLAHTNFYTYFRNLYHKYCGSWAFGIRRKKFIFKPFKKTTIHSANSNINADSEKHNQRPNTHPVAEKQTLLKNKKKVGISE